MAGALKAESAKDEASIMAKGSKGDQAISRTICRAEIGDLARVGGIIAPGCQREVRDR